MNDTILNTLKDKTLLKTCSFINGQWCKSNNSFSVVNPSNNQRIAQVDDVDIDNVEKAVNAASSAHIHWSSLTANERAIILRRWFNLIIEHKLDLAHILTLEQGKPLAESIGEIGYGASFIEWFAEEGKRVYGDTISSPSQNKRTVVIKQSVGVVSAITPWNFPSAMIARKAAAALAAGCTFIVKPSELTPLSALALAVLAQRAGIPEGVFNVVVGSNSSQIGKVLTQSPTVSKFTFTGSTSVGKKLLSQCATTVKKTSMELGGNAPFIVFDDADIDAAVQGAIASKYRNAGQTCICTNRLFVQQSIADKFISKFTQAVEALKLSDGLNQHVDIGPMISTDAVKKVQNLIALSVDAGAQVKVGGVIDHQGDCFLQPTILTNVSNDMPIARNEIFGPVTPIISFNTEDEVIKMANDTEYGLAAYFYSRDIGRVWRVAESLEFGMVGINDGMISDAAAPFGGIKESGNGREGSKYGLDDYLEIKYLSMGGI